MASEPTITARRQAEERQRLVIVKVLRGVFVVLLFLVTALGIVRDSTSGWPGVELGRWWPVVVLLVLAFFAGIVGIDVLTPRRKLSAVSAILFGCLVGLIATAVIGLVINFFVQVYEPPKSWERTVLLGEVVLGLGLCYLGITTVLQTQDDFRLVIPYVEFAKQYRGSRPLLIDTSALIDARILAVAETGVIQSPIIVPRFVIEELQLLADKGDAARRQKGRRGLDVLTRLQRSPRLDITINDQQAAGKDVDQKLVSLAEALPADIITTDFALNQVASIHDVGVLNLNEVANALKASVVPDDVLTVKLIRRGEHDRQAVGYLEDGAMVIAEDADHAIGQTVTLRVVNTMQTAAGRLIFAALAGPPMAAPAPGGVAPVLPLPAIPPAAPAVEPMDHRPAPPGNPPPPSAPDPAERTEATDPEAPGHTEPAGTSSGPLGPHGERRLKKRPSRNPRRR